jgi:hypothetical protein
MFAHFLEAHPINIKSLSPEMQQQQQGIDANRSFDFVNVELE